KIEDVSRVNKVPKVAKLDRPWIEQYRTLSSMANAVNPAEFFPENRFPDESSSKTYHVLMQICRTILHSARNKTWDVEGLHVLEKLGAWMATLLAERDYGV